MAMTTKPLEHMDLEGVQLLFIYALFSVSKKMIPNCNFYFCPKIIF